MLELYTVDTNPRNMAHLHLVLHGVSGCTRIWLIVVQSRVYHHQNNQRPSDTRNQQPTVLHQQSFTREGPTENVAGSGKLGYFRHFGFQVHFQGCFPIRSHRDISKTRQVQAGSLRIPTSSITAFQTMMPWYVPACLRNKRSMTEIQSCPASAKTIRQHHSTNGSKQLLPPNFTKSEGGLLLANLKA